MSLISSDLMLQGKNLVSSGKLKQSGGVWRAVLKVRNLDPDAEGAPWHQVSRSTGVPVGDDPEESARLAQRKLESWRDEVMLEKISEVTERIASSVIDRERARARGANVERLSVPMVEYALEMVRTKHDAGEIEGSTVSGYLTTIRAHIAPVLGDKPLNEVDSHDVERCLAELRARGLGSSQCRKARSMLKATFDYAMYHDGLESNPCTRVRAPRQAPARHNELSVAGAAELVRTLEGMRQDRHVCAARLALRYGLGEGEACALRWAQCLGDRDSFEIADAIGAGPGGSYLKSTKTDPRTRTLPLNDSGRRIFADRLEEARREWEAAGLQGPGPDDYVLGRTNGRWTAPNTIGKKWAALSSSMGWTGSLGLPLSFYDLRHTFASVLLQKGVDPKTIQYLMGHSSLGTTLGVYANSSAASRADAMRALDRAYEGADEDKDDQGPSMSNEELAAAIRSLIGAAS